MKLEVYRLHCPLNTAVSFKVLPNEKNLFSGIWLLVEAVPYDTNTCYIPNSSDPLNTFRGSAMSTTIVMTIATIMYNAKSHIKQANQYTSGEVPVISCSCLAFDTLSIKGNIWKLPVKNSKPNGIRVIHDNMTPICLTRPSPNTR